MDGLKIINDTCGHQAGNRTLQTLSERLSRELSDRDTAYHFHGDEFCIVTDELDESYVEGLMLRVRTEECPKFSYGSAHWPEEGATWSEVDNIADERMRENKGKRKASGEAPERPQ